MFSECGPFCLSSKHGGGNQSVQMAPKMVPLGPKAPQMAPQMHGLTVAPVGGVPGATVEVPQMAPKWLPNFRNTFRNILRNTFRNTPGTF